MQPVNRESYVFPATVKHVFFSDDPTHRGLKIVVDKEARGVRCMADEEEPQLGPNSFAAGVQAESHTRDLTSIYNIHTHKQWLMALWYQMNLFPHFTEEA